MSNRDFRVNEQIRVVEVRVIDHDGKQLGVMPTRQAIAVAAERGLDLVEVAPNSEPPVTRITDYGKFAYQRARRERDARRAQKTTEVKEIRLRPKTGDHDVGYKMRDARRFLERGDKVRLRVIFRGREMAHMEFGHQLIQKLAAGLTDIATIEQQPSMEGRTLNLVLAPIKQK